MRITDDYTNPTTNEGNLLSLITLKNILGGEGGADATIKAMAKEETRHLMLAMKILTHDPPDAQKNGVTAMATARLQDKFGRDMAGAVRLGRLLKAKGDEREVDLMLDPFIMDTLAGKTKTQQVRSGFGALGTRSGLGAAFE